MIYAIMQTSYNGMQKPTLRVGSHSLKMSVSDWKETNDFSSLSYFCTGPIQLPLICEGHETKLGADQMCTHFVSVNFCGLWNKVKIWMEQNEEQLKCALSLPQS